MPARPKLTQARWREAFGYYIALGPTRTLVRVAARYGVSDVAVGKRARAEGWDDVCGPVDEARIEEMMRRVVEHRVGAIGKFGEVPLE